MTKNLFNSIQVKSVKSNRFDLTHDVKMSFRMGELVPSCIMDVIPGDKISISTENLLRFSPLISPVMHRIKVTTHFFFVPNRILWNNWEDWITGNLEVQPPKTKPILEVDDENTYRIHEGSIADYLGLPSTYMSAEKDPIEPSAFPFAAYAKIYWEYYRDQNLITDSSDNSAFEEACELIDGMNWTSGSAQDYLIQELFFLRRPPKRAWNHDYFTSALPFAQKGQAMNVPIGNFALEYDHEGGNTVVRQADGTTFPSIYNSTVKIGNGSFPRETSGDGPVANFDVTANHKVVPVGDGTTTITDLRRAFKLQEWLELNARGGTRYKESIMAHFGVRSSDGRLQRPEYLGGSVQNMVISEVLSTAENDVSGVPVGDMAGHGISVGAGKQFSYYAEEHGWIIGIINVQPLTAYQQGMARMWNRNDRLDYFWPTFQHIGEQEVLMSELYALDGKENTEEVFGYIPRYAEYKYIPNRVAGEFKSSLSFWHLGRIFEEKPQLTAEFIECNPRTDIFAVEDNVDHIYAHVLNKISAVRKMAVYGNPFM